MSQFAQAGLPAPLIRQKLWARLHNIEDGLYVEQSDSGVETGLLIEFTKIGPLGSATSEVSQLRQDAIIVVP